MVGTKLAAIQAKTDSKKLFSFGVGLCALAISGTLPAMALAENAVGARSATTGQLKAALPAKAPAGFTLDQVVADMAGGSAVVRASYEKQTKAAGGGGPMMLR